ncbi:MAG: glutamate-cysteine ligase family protein, partial [Aeoliella sp.]
MAIIEFHPNERPTLGIEIELGLVDAKTMALSSAYGPLEEKLRSDVGEEAAGVKHELMQCVLEINTGICETIDEAEADLQTKLHAVEQACDALGLRLWWGAS